MLKSSLHESMGMATMLAAKQVNSIVLFEPTLSVAPFLYE